MGRPAEAGAGHGRSGSLATAQTALARPVSGATPVEFAAVTGFPLCDPLNNSPGQLVIQETLYNLPSGASPSLSATISAGPNSGR